MLLQAKTNKVLRAACAGIGKGLRQAKAARRRLRELENPFVSMISEDTQDLDPEFSELIDKHFWELV